MAVVRFRIARCPFFVRLYTLGGRCHLVSIFPFDMWFSHVFCNNSYSFGDHLLYRLTSYSLVLKSILFRTTEYPPEIRHQTLNNLGSPQFSELPVQLEWIRGNRDFSRYITVLYNVRVRVKFPAGINMKHNDYIYIYCKTCRDFTPPTSPMSCQFQYLPQ